MVPPRLCGLGRRGQSQPIIIVLLLVVGLMVAGSVGVYLKRMASDDLNDVEKSKDQFKEALDTKLDVIAAYGTKDTVGPRANVFCSEGCEASDASMRVVLLIKNTGENTIYRSQYENLKIYMNEKPLSNGTEYRLDETKDLTRGAQMNVPLNITCSQVGETLEHRAEFKVGPPKGTPGVGIVDCTACCGEEERCLTAC